MTRTPKGLAFKRVLKGVRTCLQLPTTAGHSSLLFLALLQRLADFSEQKPNDTDLHVARASEFSHRSHQWTKTSLQSKPEKRALCCSNLASDILKVVLFPLDKYLFCVFKFSLCDCFGA